MWEEKVATILQSAERVNQSLSPESSERNYHNALEVELEFRGMDFLSEPRYPNMYRGVEVGYISPDMVIRGHKSGVIVELKSSKSPQRAEEQVRYYMDTFNDINVGVAISFRDSLEYEVYL